jgi:hypothetical protein
LPATRNWTARDLIVLFQASKFLPSFLPGSSADRGDEEGEKQSNFLANNQVETRSFFGQKDEEEEGKTIRIFSMMMGLRQ